MEWGSDVGGESREASAFFVDLIGSTAMAEVLPSSEVVSTLNAFFEAVVDEGGAKEERAVDTYGPEGRPEQAKRYVTTASSLRG